MASVAAARLQLPIAPVRINEQDGPKMGSNSKKRTTMAKLNRETRLREKRFEKQARKDARKRAAAEEGAAVSSGTAHEGVDAPTEGGRVAGERTTEGTSHERCRGNARAPASPQGRLENTCNQLFRLAAAVGRA